MGKSAPTPPPAPDYMGAAQAQGQANLTASQQGAVLSNPNIYGPLGNQTVNYSNVTGPDGQTYMQPNVNQSLTPQGQQTLTAQQRVQLGMANVGAQALDSAGGILGQQFNPQNVGVQTSLGNTGPVVGAPNLSDMGQARGNVQGPNLQTSLNTNGVAAMPVNAGMTGQQALMARLQPQINQSNAALAQQLANQGIASGSEAYGNAQRVQGQNNNDLTSQAALQGIGLDMSANAQGMQNALNSGNFANNAQLQQFQSGLQSAGLYNSALGQNQNAALMQQQAANSAQGQQFNQALQAGQFGNQASAQNLQQQLAMYNQPLNQISALMSGSQIQMPQFQQYTGQNVTPAPIANATSQMGQYQQNLYGQQVAAQNANTQALGSALGSAAGMFSFAPIALSDVRLKSNIVRVGTHPLGIGIYDYDIFGERTRGVMAHEVETVRPDAVITLPSGYKAVNYGALNG